MVFGLIISVGAIYLSRYWTSKFIVDNGDCKYATRNNGWWSDDPTVVLILAWISRREEIFKIFTTWKSRVNGHHTKTVIDLQQEWSPGPLMISTHRSDRRLLRTCSIGILKPLRLVQQSIKSNHKGFNDYGKQRVVLILVLVVLNRSSTLSSVNSTTTNPNNPLIIRPQENNEFSLTAKSMSIAGHPNA